MCTLSSGVSIVPRLFDDGRAPAAASWSLMYLRVCSMAGEPDGRGPIATSCRRCSQARPESNFGARRDAAPGSREQRRARERVCSHRRILRPFLPAARSRAARGPV